MFPPSKKTEKTPYPPGTNPGNLATTHPDLRWGKQGGISPQCISIDPDFSRCHSD
jgi:hypothetical protein